eukprot:138195_1
MASGADRITREFIVTMHQNQIKSGISNSHKTVDIVDVLGGIDKILANYLMTNDAQYHLNKNKLNKLHQLLKLNKTNQKRTDTDGLENKKMRFVNNDSLFYELDENNNYLNELFGSNIAAKTFTMLHSRFTFIVIVIGFIMWNIIRQVYDSHSVIYLLYSTCFCAFLSCPYWITWILSSNKRAITLTVKTFEFWFKVYYAFWVQILLTFRTYHELKTETFDKQRVSLIYTEQVLQCLNSTILIAAFYLFDAIKMKRTYKSIGAILLSIIFFWYSFDFQFTNLYDHRINVKATGRILSINSMISNSYRILAIFLMKQGIVTAITKNRCTTINVSPYICWTNDNVVNAPSSLDAHSSNVQIQYKKDENDLSGTNGALEVIVAQGARTGGHHDQHHDQYSISSLAIAENSIAT